MTASCPWRWFRSPDTTVQHTFRTRVAAAAASILLIAACADEFAVDPVDGFTADISADGWPDQLVVGDTITLRAEVRDEASGARVAPRAIDWSVAPAGALEILGSDGDSVRFRVAAIGAIQLGASLDDPAFDTASVRATLQGVLFGIDVQALASDTLHSLGDTAQVQVVAFDRHGQPFPASGFAWTVRGAAVAPTGPQTSASVRVVAAANGRAWVIASHEHCVSGGVCRDSVAVDVWQQPASVAFATDSVRLGALTATTELSTSVRDARGEPITDARGIVWESSSSAVSLLVDPTDSTRATLTAAANGSALIRVRVGALQDSLVARVEQVAASVALSVDSLRLGSLGATAALTATVRDAAGVLIGAPAGLQWETSSTAVATIAVNPSDPTQATVTAAGNGSTLAHVSAGGGATDQATVVVQQVVTSAVALGAATRSGTVGQLLADSIRVEARDARGSPVPGASVVWSVIAGGGTVTGVGITGADGRAAAAWRLGNVPGANQVRAIVAGSDTAFFAATAAAGAATSLTITPGDTTLTSLGTTIAYTATLRDALANVVPGVVGWSTSAPAVATVSATGTVTPLANGNAAIVASSGTLADTVFVTIQQAAATITLSVDSLRFAALGATASVSATVRDASGAPVAAPRGITWESTTGAASVSVAGADSSQATVTSTANGSAVLRVRIGGLTDEASVVVQQVVSSASIVAGANQSGGVGATLPDSLRVEARDALGSPVPGAPVVWSVLSGGGSVSGSTTTGANGRAAVRWTLGTTLGTQQVRAIVAGSDTLVFSATATAGAAAMLTLTPVSATLNFVGDTTQLVALVQDAFGNTVPAAITWSSTNEAVVSVGSTGVVTAVGAGSASVIAQAGTLADTSAITVQQVVASIAIAPAADTLTAGDTLRLTATPRDSLGSAIAGASVAWSSTDTLVATVDAAGKVTARANGITSIRASVGAVTGSASIAVAAWALSFDGDDFAEVPNDAAIEGDSIFTVELWVRPDSTNGGALLAVWGTTRQTSSWALRLNGLVPQLLIRAPSGAVVDTVSGGPPLAEDVWQHVAFVYDRGSAVIYVNGAPVASDTGLVRPNQDGTPTLRFGADATGAGGLPASFLNGDLDEIRIWSSARTQAELAADMTASVAGQPGLRAWWPLASGSGHPVDQVAGLIATRGGTLGLTSTPTWIMDGAPAP
ncbi:MAG TPA: LamG-like jellyroll fold domain-containing protein [Longimicrobiales bacterium]